jgi:hypothetical protein
MQFSSIFQCIIASITDKGKIIFVGHVLKASHDHHICNRKKTFPTQYIGLLSPVINFSQLTQFHLHDSNILVYCYGLGVTIDGVWISEWIY